MVRKVVAATRKSGVVLKLDRAADFAVCVAVEPEVPPVRLPVAPLPAPLAPLPLVPLGPDAPELAAAVPKSCADEKVWQLEEAGRVGVYGGVGTTPSGGWNQVVVAPLVVKTPGGVISSESQTS